MHHDLTTSPSSEDLRAHAHTHCKSIPTHTRYTLPHRVTGHGRCEEKTGNLSSEKDKRKDNGKKKAEGDTVRLCWVGFPEYSSAKTHHPKKSNRSRTLQCRQIHHASFYFHTSHVAYSVLHQLSMAASSERRVGIYLFKVRHMLQRQQVVYTGFPHKAVKTGWRWGLQLSVILNID